MMKKLLVIGIAIIMLLTVGVMVPEPMVKEVEGAILTVPGSHSTIQAAVDAASPGDTIVVDTGTYTESVTVNKDITLKSKNGAAVTTIKCPSSPSGIKLPEYNSGGKNVEYTIAFLGGTISGGTVFGTGTINIKFSGFTINGDTYSPGQEFANVLVRNANADIQDNIVKNAEIGSKKTYGIFTIGDSDLNIEGNTVSEYGRGGIYVLGDGYPGTNGPAPDPTFTVVDNEITGPGTSPGSWAPNGIVVGHDASGHIISNDVSENGYPGPKWSGTNIMAYDTSNVVVDNNFVHDGELGIAIGSYWSSASSISVGNNNIIDNIYGIDVINDMNGATIHHNTIRGSVESGIELWNYGWGSPSPTNTEIHHNIIEENGWYGIWLDTSDFNTIHHNEIYENKKSGIYLQQSDENGIHHNIINKNKENGIRSHGSLNNIVHHNSINVNGWAGIVIWKGSNYNTVHHNKVMENYLRGIAVRDHSYFNNIFKNSVHEHGDTWGDLVEDGGSSDNTWSKNDYDTSYGI